MDAVSPYDNPGPSDVLPATAIFLDPRLSFENLVLMSQNLFCLVRLAISIQVSDRSALGQYVMIRFERKLNALLLVVKIKV